MEYFVCSVRLWASIEHNGFFSQSENIVETQKLVETQNIKKNIETRHFNACANRSSSAQITNKMQFMVCF